MKQTIKQPFDELLIAPKHLSVFLQNSDKETIVRTSLESRVELALV